MRMGTWASGLVGSVAAHAGMLVFLGVAINPEPVTEQPMPESQLEVQAYQLDRTEAREQPPESHKTDARTPDGAALDAGAIPQSRARPAPALAETVRPDTARPPSAMEVRAAVAEISQATAPAVAPLAAVLRSGSLLAVSQPVMVAMQTTTPPSTALPTAIQQSINVAQSAPRPIAAVSGNVDAAHVDSAVPSAKKLKAALAFSGAGGDVDPVSIAAFQRFMQPGDVAAGGDQLRDGVSGLLAQVPCSRMQVAFDPDTATLHVNGHIPDNDLRAPVLAALRAQMGANISVSDNILILPRPQCGALSGIAGVGLPQSTDQITNPLVIGEDAHARVFHFADGELLSLDMTAPDYDAFIYLDYFDADGTVLHLEPNEYAPLRQASAQTAQKIGARTMQDSGLKLVIGPPYGQEIAVAFAASEPLYDGLRPIQEPAAPYLEWLKTQVERARANHPDFKGEWVYFFVSTTGN